MESIENLQDSKNTYNFEFYKLCKEDSLWLKLSAALSGAFLLFLSGKIKISLPFTPVPITAQTFTLFVLAISLRFETSVLSLLFYLSLIAGFSGIDTFLHPTAGYLIGFVIAGTFISYLFDRFEWARRSLNLFIILTVANFFIIHSLGILGLSLCLKTYDLHKLFLIGSAPFIPGDMLKIFIVIFIAKRYFSSGGIND